MAVGSRGSEETLANSGGDRNAIVSSGPFNVETSTGPSRRNQFTTPSTSSSGAEAPAVTPTDFTLSNHSLRNSSLSAMKWLRTPALAREV